MKKLFLFMLLMMIVGLTACNTTSTVTNSTNSSQMTTNETTPTNTTTKPQAVDECHKAPNKDNWIPVWCEEFDNDGQPDPLKWTLENKGDGFGNGELQYYTNRLDNAIVENGELTITVKKESFNGKNYTSAKLSSRNKGDFLYGKIEVKAKLPEGKGTWPAIWMMPTDSQYGGWPKSGEIDIMEHVGYDMNKVHGTVHTENYNHKMGTQVGKGIEVDEVVDYYHVYAIEWDPSGIKWFVDGFKYHEFKNDAFRNPDNSSANWPFDQKFYLILNIAFGGDWGGALGIDPNFVESRMVVDYVRVFQKDYQSIDYELPTDVTGFNTISNSPTNTKITWVKSTDDTGISHYEVLLNNQEVDPVSQSSYQFNNLDQNTEYELKVTAVDFAGKKSSPVTYTFTTSGFLPLPGKVNASEYIEMRGIQLQPTNDLGGGKHVAYIDIGDYMLYRLYVSEAGTYRIKARIASTSANRELQLYQYENYTNTLLTKIIFNSTGAYTNWATVDGAESFTLEEGVIELRLRANTNGFNVNWFELVKVE